MTLHERAALVLDRYDSVNKISKHQHRIGDDEWFKERAPAYVGTNWNYDKIKSKNANAVKTKLGMHSHRDWTTNSQTGYVDNGRTDFGSIANRNTDVTNGTWYLAVWHKSYECKFEDRSNAQLSIVDSLSTSGTNDMHTAV